MLVAAHHRVVDERLLQRERVLVQAAPQARQPIAAEHLRGLALDEEPQPLADVQVGVRQRARQQKGILVARRGRAEPEAVPRLEAGVEATAEPDPDVAVVGKVDVLDAIEHVRVGPGAEPGPVLVLAQELVLRRFCRGAFCPGGSLLRRERHRQCAQGGQRERRAAHAAHGTGIDGHGPVVQLRPRPGATCAGCRGAHHLSRSFAAGLDRSRDLLATRRGDSPYTKTRRAMPARRHVGQAASSCAYLAPVSSCSSAFSS